MRVSSCELELERASAQGGQVDRMRTSDEILAPLRGQFDTTFLDTTRAGVPGTDAGTVDFKHGTHGDGAFSLTVDTTADAADTDADVTIDSTVGGPTTLDEGGVTAADITVTGAVTTTGGQTYTSTETRIPESASRESHGEFRRRHNGRISHFVRQRGEPDGRFHRRPVPAGIQVTGDSDATDDDGAVTIRDLRSTGLDQLARQGQLGFPRMSPSLSPVTPSP